MSSATLDVGLSYKTLAQFSGRLPEFFEYGEQGQSSRFHVAYINIKPAK